MSQRDRIRAIELESEKLDLKKTMDSHMDMLGKLVGDYTSNTSL